MSTSKSPAGLLRFTQWYGSDIRLPEPRAPVSARSCTEAFQPPQSQDSNMSQKHLISEEEADRQIRESATPAYIWSFLAESLRLAAVYELDQFKKKQQVSQTELAERTGTTQPMLSRFFSGADRRSPSLETLAKIAWGLGKRVFIDFADLPDGFPFGDSEDDGVAPSWANSLPVPNELANLVARHVRLNFVALASVDCDFLMPDGRAGGGWVIDHLKPKSSGFNVEHAFESSGDGARRHLRVRICFYDTPAVRARHVRLRQVKAMIEALYNLQDDTPKEVLEGIPSFVATYSVAHAFPVYQKVAKNFARHSFWDSHDPIDHK